MSGQQHAPAALYPRERHGTHFTGGWVSLRAGLDGRKISYPPGFDPGLSSPYLSRYTVWATRPTKAPLHLPNLYCLIYCDRRNTNYEKRKCDNVVILFGRRDGIENAIEELGFEPAVCKSLLFSTPMETSPEAQPIPAKLLSSPFPMGKAAGEWSWPFTISSAEFENLDRSRSTATLYL